jgi:hypothetical protein
MNKAQLIWNNLIHIQIIPQLGRGIDGYIDIVGQYAILKEFCKRHLQNSFRASDLNAYG